MISKNFSEEELRIIRSAGIGFIGSFEFWIIYLSTILERKLTYEQATEAYNHCWNSNKEK